MSDASFRPTLPGVNPGVRAGSAPSPAPLTRPSAPAGDGRRRVLFVDDEPRVLEGLRDLLRVKRKQWDMEFCDSGDAALAAMSANPFEVVVSDMRMPGMDGADLLARIQRRWPGTVRLILSGHTEQDAAVRAIGVAHHFLTKPCDADILAGTIERTFGVLNLLGCDALRGSVGRIHSLPARPHIHSRIVALLRDEHVTSEQVAELLEHDMALAVRVLQMANSGFFGLPRQLTRLADAVSFLGLRTVEHLALSLAVYPQEKKFAGVDMLALQRHAMSVGSLARRIVDPAELRDDAFVAGMLHDLGIALIASHLPDRFAETRQALAEHPRPLHEVEFERWGVSHAEMGAYLLGLWNMPFHVVEAVAQHHRPDGTRPPSALVTAVHVADVLVHEFMPAACPVENTAPPALDLAYLEQVGVLDRVDDWRDVARDLSATIEEAA